MRGVIGWICGIEWNDVRFDRVELIRYIVYTV